MISGGGEDIAGLSEYVRGGVVGGRASGEVQGAGRRDGGRT